MSQVDRTRARRERLYQEAEWRRCSRDFVYFVEKYVYIADKAGMDEHGSGRVRFELFDYQRRWANDLLSNKFLLFLKARQIGATTLSMAYCTWLLLFRRGGARILIISRDKDAANSNLQMIANAYTFLPEWMKARGPKVARKGTTERSWTHADGSVSQVASYPATENVSAGFTPDVVVADEADLYSKESGGFAAVQGVVQPALLAAAANQWYTSAVFIVISTIRNPKGKFADTYKAAVKGKSKFKALFEPWTSNRFMWKADRSGPDYDAYNHDREIARLEGREHEFVREYPASVEEALALSGHQYFGYIPEEHECQAAPLRGWLREHRDPETGRAGYQFQPDPTGPLHLYETPIAGRDYVMSVDPSQGVGRDSTVAYLQAWDDDGLPYVAGFWASNSIEPADFAPQLAHLGWWFNTALAVPETTGGHAALLLHVWDELGYPNIYYHVPTDQRRRRTATRPGFNTAGNGGQRALILSHARSVLAQTANIPPELRDEVLVFVVNEKNGRAEADAGLHDDHVMSFAIASYVLHERIDAAAVTTDEEPDAPDPLSYAALHAQLLAEAAKKQAARQETYTKVARRMERRAARSQRRSRR